MLTPPELKALTRISNIRAAMAITLDWFWIAVVFYLAMKMASPWAWLLGGILIARLQLGLAILMHDASHRRLFSHGRWNDYLSQWLLGAPLLFSMYSYRKLHLKHHRNPLAKEDPDLSLIGGYPVTRASFARKLFRDAVGISYFKFIRYFIYMARNANRDQARPSAQTQPTIGATDSMPLWLVASSIIATNLLIWFVLFSLGNGWLYLMWVLPAMTFLQVLLRIRGVAEHAGFQPNEDQSQNARTVLNTWQTMIFAPHEVYYHVEHHLYPSIPFYNLAEAHRLLSARGDIPVKNTYSGYGDVLREILIK